MDKFKKLWLNMGVCVQRESEKEFYEDSFTSELCLTVGSLPLWRSGGREKERSPHYHATVRRPSAHPSPFIQTHKELRGIPEFFYKLLWYQIRLVIRVRFISNSQRNAEKEKKRQSVNRNVFKYVCHGTFYDVTFSFLLLLSPQHYGS